MTFNFQIPILLAASLVSTACGAEDRNANSSLAGVDNLAVARADDSRSGRRSDARTEPMMIHQRIVISSEQGQVTAELVDSAATRALMRMLPVTIEMRDHLRQEKTGNLPSPLPEVRRQANFSAGTLGLWGNEDFVIYYRNGRVPAPGIIVLGRVVGDVAIFNRPGPVTVRIERAE